jgi:hypothetical protein
MPTELSRLYGIWVRLVIVLLRILKAGVGEHNAGIRE